MALTARGSGRQPIHHANRKNGVPGRIGKAHPAIARVISSFRVPWWDWRISFCTP